MRMFEITPRQKIASILANMYADSKSVSHIMAAEAVILALREPSLGMLEAAMPNCSDWGYLPEEWQAMIDFAATD